MTQDEVQPQASPGTAGLRPHEDARAVVSLFQCAQCSYPLREPITLPCGNSICKPCMPSSHVRTNITYPQNADRAAGFDCPFPDCAVEHSLADCSLDVMLNKVVGVTKSQMSLFAASSEPALQVQLREQLDLSSVVDRNIDLMPRSRVSSSGCIVSAFLMADAGELNYHSDLTFTSIEPEDEETIKTFDVAVANTLKDLIRAETECHVCYGLMVDPVTTPCGHTFCRKCVARVLDHSTLCPACRRPMSMRPGVVTESTNKVISNIIQGLLGDELAARILAIQEDEHLNDENWVSLFPCSLAYPNMPTFLHIFEPRYRLMVRRCLENGSRKFGMLMYNGRGIPQGRLGQSQYMQYGTMLHIARIEVFSDGRSLLETQGIYRFKVLEGAMLDGYHTGRIQRIDDMPLAEEEAAEALETSGPEPDDDDWDAQIDHMSTQALLQHGLDFIIGARARSADWLHERVLQAYGQPPIDPALFPFWFASVLPIRDDVKYQLLPLTSVRERLKMTVRWIKVLEEQRCPGQRYPLVVRPVQSEQDEEETEAAQPQEANTTSEPQAAASNEVEGESEELYAAEDPRNTHSAETGPPANQA